MIPERLPGRLFEHVVEAATGRCRDRPRRQTAMLCYELVEYRDAIGPVVAVSIDHHKTSAAEGDAGHRIGIFAPPSAHALRVGAHRLPARDDRLFLPSAIHPAEADRKHRNAGFGEIDGGLEVARLNV